MENSTVNNQSSSSFSKKLEEAMKMRGINQKQLAELIGVTPQSISYYCKGTRLPDVDILRAIANNLKVSADYLLGLADSPNPDINIREISRLTGLTELSIERLQDEIKWICDIGKNNMPQEALKNWLSTVELKNRIIYPKFHTINLLLAEQPTEGDAIIEILGEILGFKKQPKNVEIDDEKYYGLFPCVTKYESDGIFFDTNSFPNYILTHNDMFEVLILQLQSTIKRYKDKSEKGNNS